MPEYLDIYPYTTVADLRERLVQLGDNVIDATLQDYIDIAQSIVDGEIGRWTDYPLTSTVQSYVTGRVSYLITNSCQDGSLDGIYYDALKTNPIDDVISKREGNHYVLYAPTLWINYGDYIYVNAKWGNGKPPYRAKEAVLQVAVRLYRSKTAGYSDAIGVGNSVAYQGAFSNLVKEIMNSTQAGDDYSGDIIV